MPIYEYACDECGVTFEELVLDAKDPACPDCGSTSTHKLMSRCSHTTGGGNGRDAAPPAPASGCAGCAGGHCATCGH
jgi:putative FmdB family regulatory protein